MRSEQEAERAIRLYSDTIRRICFVHLKNHADVEDIFQDVFLKYILSDTVFKNNEHEKAWFIRVTVNVCRDLIKSAFRSRSVSLEEALNATSNTNEDDRHVLEAVLKLPKKYRDIVYLHYYEGYTAPEIGKILNKNENTVYTILKRARELLKKSLGGDENG